MAWHVTLGGIQKDDDGEDEPWYRVMLPNGDTFDVVAVDQNDALKEAKKNWGDRPVSPAPSATPEKRDV